MCVCVCVCLRVCVCVCIYVYMYIPGAPTTSIFEGQAQNKVFSSQNKGHLGSRYVCIYIYYNI